LLSLLSFPSPFGLFAGAICELNVDHLIRTSIRELIDKGEISSSMMDAAEKHCINLLRFSVFPLWKTSFGFKELMKKHKVRDITELRQGKPLARGVPRAHVEEQIEVQDLAHI